MTRKYYNNVYFYTIDAPTATSHGPLKPPTANVREPEHRFLCRRMEETVKEILGLDVERIYSPGNFSKKTFFGRIVDELKDKTKEGLLIFYYHGKAGGKKKAYSWAFSKSAAKPIDANKLITMICECEADSILLLDCELPTSMTTQWCRRTGTTEIIHVGGYLKDTDGELMEQDGDSLTEAFIRGLDTWAAGIVDRKKQNNAWFGTLREVIKGNKELSYKAGGWAVQGKEDVVAVRIKLARGTTGRRKLEFVGDVKLKRDKASEAADSEPEVEDEGFGEMEVEVAKTDEQAGGTGGTSGEHGEHGEAEGFGEGLGEAIDEILSDWKGAGTEESVFVQPDEI